MTYTQLSAVAVILALSIDLAVLRTGLVKRKVFWVSYAIILTFQFITNGLFTGLQIVKYRDFAILGSDSPLNAPPPFIGDGRLFFAPVEDLGFGFSLVLLSMSLWTFFQRQTSDKTIAAGPPRTNLFSRL